MLINIGAEFGTHLESSEIAVELIDILNKIPEDDFIIAAIDQGLDENEIKIQLENLHNTHINDSDLINIKKEIEEDELDLISLKQNRKIYLYYLEHNEGDE